VLADLRDGKPGQRKAEAVRKLTGEGFNLNDEAGGEAGFASAPRWSLKAG